jgi:VanZ family protein
MRGGGEWALVKVISRDMSYRARDMGRIALLWAVLLLVVTAYWPFHWDPPRIVHNEVTRGTAGSLNFGDMNRARTPGTPGWLAQARGSGELEIEIELDPQPSQEQSPASIMMLARDFWHTDIAIGQDHSALLVWLRRPGSDGNGNPPFTVRGALRAREWNRVDVRVLDDRIRINVDGRRRLSAPLPDNSIRTWGEGQLVLGDEVHGGGPWQGTIRRAEVRTPGFAVDYTRPGALSIPAHYLYFPDHVAPFPPLGRGEWVALFLHFLSFVAVGFLIVTTRVPPFRPIAATVIAAGLAVALAAGKLLFHGRHTEVTDLAGQTAGALVGAVLAWRWAHRQAQEQPEPRIRPEPPS